VWCHGGLQCRSGFEAFPIKTRREYTVRFNRKIAGTVSYADRDGVLIFVFDMLRRGRRLILHRHPFQDGQLVRLDSPEASARLDKAWHRVKLFLEMKGYDVVVVESPYQI
jgi:hypothetical protein